MHCMEIAMHGKFIHNWNACEHQPIKSRPVTQTLSDFDQRQCQCQCQRNQIQLNCSNVLSTTAVRTFLFPGTLSRFPTNDVDISRSGAAGAGRGGRLSGLEAAHPKIEHWQSRRHFGIGTHFRRTLLVTLILTFTLTLELELAFQHHLSSISMKSQFLTTDDYDMYQNRYCPILHKNHCFV